MRSCPASAVLMIRVTSTKWSGILGDLQEFSLSGPLGRSFSLSLALESNNDGKNPLHICNFRDLLPAVQCCLQS